ncbi:hypothetical protein ACIHJG_35260 [Streptomyces sp. NPDC052415]|uniref:hypothetical protein n=1 Tax=Streptomyces sp. NPDC052415 TaxID=3365690 RepID=UPI0037CFFAD3
MASAHPSPATPYAEWDSETRLALLPLGRIFDAVRIPVAVAHRAFAGHDVSVVCRRMARHLHGGPVIHDPEGRRYYALVPPGTARDWQAPAAQCLGEGTYLGVPHPTLTELAPGTRLLYWAVPMARPGKLCQMSDVLTVAMVGGALPHESDVAGS